MHTWQIKWKLHRKRQFASTTKARTVPSLDHLGSAHSSHHNVSAAHRFGDVLGARVRDGDGGVALHQQQRHRDANHVGATDHHRLLALDTDTAAVQQLNAALCAWYGMVDVEPHG